jgi:protein-L-isoaspartate O-methyltransferase
MKELADKSRENIAKFAKRFDIKKIKIIHGDGRKGLVEKQPFDYIHCGAGK